MLCQPHHILYTIPQTQTLGIKPYIIAYWSFDETSSEKAYICLLRRILKKADNLEKKLKNILDLSLIAASLLYL